MSRWTHDSVRLWAGWLFWLIRYVVEMTSVSSQHTSGCLHIVDLGVCAFSTTVPWVLWSRSHTWSPLCSSGRTLAKWRMSKLAFYRAFSMSISAELNPCSKGVERYASKALTGICDLLSKCFTVWTERSISPFAWAYFGLVVMWVSPNSYANLQVTFHD